MAKAKARREELELQQAVEQRKKDKEQEKLAKERVRSVILIITSLIQLNFMKYILITAYFNDFVRQFFGTVESVMDFILKSFR